LNAIAVNPRYLIIETNVFPTVSLLKMSKEKLFEHGELIIETYEKYSDAGILRYQC